VAVRQRHSVSGVEKLLASAPSDGQLIYAANGRLSVQIAYAPHKKFPAGSAETFTSYFGRWELDSANGCVIHYVDASLSADQDGQAMKRYYSFDGAGHLVLTTPPTKDATGRDVVTVIVWDPVR
jgi:hypothetical protein